MNKLNKLIVDEITESVKSVKSDTKYRAPLVGFADANDPYFKRLKTIISEEHYLPSDLLSEAKTVVTFFIPFDEEIVYKNLKCDTTAREWAYGKKDAQELIGEIIDGMKAKLRDINVGCSENPNKEPYNQEKFMHRWSLRHMAYICGLGNFGLNQLMITDSGCAGRFGSFVIDCRTDYDKPVPEEYCLYKYNKSCGLCVKNCPSGALTFEGIDKTKCSKWINDITEKHFDGIRIFRTCGKCITPPCALKRPR
ncbi:MAG: epoxyqueuosine reductase [Clostridiaceae bacterium]